MAGNTAFNYQMPPEYVSSTQDVINTLGAKIEAPVLFSQVWAMLSENGKKKNVTAYDVFSFLLNCQKLQLNPMLKQIYGFESKGKVVTVISVEGWNEIANRHPQFDGFDYEFPETVERELSYQKSTYDNGYRKTSTVTVKRRVSDWMICRVYRKDRSHPIAITTFFDEASTGTEPWATMPMQMLQNRAMVNAIKKAFNINAYAEDDRSYDMPTYQEVMTGSEPQTPVSVTPVAEIPAPTDVPCLDAPQDNNSLLAGVISDPMPIPEHLMDTIKARATHLDVTEPPKRKRAPRKVKTEETPIETPVEPSVVPAEVSEESIPTPVTPPVTPPVPELPPLPSLKKDDAIPEPKMSATASDLAEMLIKANDKTKLQFYGTVIAQFKDLSQSDKDLLRRLYAQRLEEFNHA